MHENTNNVTQLCLKYLLNKYFLSIRNGEPWWGPPKFSRPDTPTPKRSVASLDWPTLVTQLTVQIRTRLPEKKSSFSSRNSTQTISLKPFRQKFQKRIRKLILMKSDLFTIFESDDFCIESNASALFLLLCINAVWLIENKVYFKWLSTSLVCNYSIENLCIDFYESFFYLCVFPYTRQLPR